MRRIALINQKGGVGKTTTTVNLGAALALAGKRVIIVDLDPQANLTLYLGVELTPGAPSSYRVLTGEVGFREALLGTHTPNLRILPTDIHLSGAELELSSAEGREGLLRRAVESWCTDHARRHPGEEPADYVLFDCPPSLGLLSLNALTAADEVFLVVQTQFLALQGMSKLVEVIDLVKQRLHPKLELSGIVPCMYDSRMRLAREVLSELRRYFPTQVFRAPISSNVKLAESPSFGQTIFEYAPESIGARDFALLAHEVLTQEALRRAANPPPDSGEPVPAPKARKRAPLVPLPAPTPEPTPTQAPVEFRGSEGASSTTEPEARRKSRPNGVAGPVSIPMPPSQAENASRPPRRVRSRPAGS